MSITDDNIALTLRLASGQPIDIADQQMLVRWQHRDAVMWEAANGTPTQRRRIRAALRNAFVATPHSDAVLSAVYAMDGKYSVAAVYARRAGSVNLAHLVLRLVASGLSPASYRAMLTTQLDRYAVEIGGAA